MAEWANRHLPVSSGEKPWNYAAFYGAGSLAFEGYYPWVLAVQAVIRRKMALYGWTFAPQITPYSAAEFRKSPWWRGQIEIVHGQIFPCTPPVEDEAKIVVARLSDLLREFVLCNQLGRFYPAGTHFTVSNAPDTVLSPHAAFICRQRKPLKSRVAWVPMRPDMVLEARSRDDFNRRLDTKIAWWLAEGIPAVWELDTYRRQMIIHSEDKLPKVISEQGTLNGGELFPAFELCVATLFL